MDQSKPQTLKEQQEQEEQYLTTDQGVRINHTDDTLKAGSRGPTLIEDFHFREKITHFDHERIPERVVHARGAGAHGYFQVYESMKEYTKAGFLQDPSVKTPVFVRFSTVVGSKGSADTVRDVRGFATKFYTSEGNYDLVGNNIPVFFIQDGIKFPDLVHAIKPEPHNAMPQASSAHDNFWDFISLMPESMHMIMWLLSDRAIPRSFRMMEGFGVHTFRFINEDGKARFVKFHWKPLLGKHSLVWDEAQKLAGKDPDWLRRDLWEAIETGAYPEFELGVQIIEEEDEFAFDFDLLDATKVIPEELIPVQIIGKMTLNRNPDSFFAETEQVAFHPGNVIPGIDFTNDPLLHGRLFSYIDTQLTRLGGPNFAEIPINRPHVPVVNHQQDGFMRQHNNKGRANYFPNTTGGGCPMMTPEKMGGYVHYMQKVEGSKTRERSESFKDHYSQAKLFWNSLSKPEKHHLVEAAHFELGKVGIKGIRERLVYHFSFIDAELAEQVAKGIGVTTIPEESKKIVESVQERPPQMSGKKMVGKSEALSMQKTIKDTIKSRRVAILIADGVNSDEVLQMKDALTSGGAQVVVISKFLGTVQGANGDNLEVDQNAITTSSVLFDAVFVPGGKHVEMLKQEGAAVHFISEAYKHCKAIAASGKGVELLVEAKVRAAEATDSGAEKGVIVVADFSSSPDFIGKFIEAIAQHRHWNRGEKEIIPA